MTHQDAMTHPSVDSIIQCGAFFYHYLGSYHQSHDQYSKMLMYDYDPNSPNYMFVRAVYKHTDGQFYYIPSVFSNIGTLNPSKSWTFVQRVDSPIHTLEIEICKKECAGYLDLFSFITKSN